MEYLPGYDNWKGASPMDEQVNDANACFYCGVEEDEDKTLVNFYEEELFKTVLVCEECIELIARGEL